MTERMISAAMPYESKFVAVEGSRIHYVEEGRGDPILFVHGNPTSCYLWRNVIPHLASDARCLALDLVGMGRSGKPDPAARRPVWRWPNEIPVDGEPADVTALVGEYSAWLGSSSVPKLLLHAQPGAILRKDLVAWCREHVKNLTTVDAGPGLHFIQEDRPHEIGEAIRTWYRGLCG